MMVWIPNEDESEVDELQNLVQWVLVTGEDLMTVPLIFVQVGYADNVRLSNFINSNLRLYDFYHELCNQVVNK